MSDQAYPIPEQSPHQNRTVAPSPPNAPPPGWLDDTRQRTWVDPHHRAAVWAWLNDPRTFTKQIWPYRVEFLPGTGVRGGSGFEAGVLNTHHGPLLRAAGVLTEVDPGHDGNGRSRTLEYFYGSSAIAFRLARPYKLTFDLEDATDGGTRVTVRLQSFVRPAFAPIWRFGAGGFWRLFPASMRCGVRAKRRRESHAAQQPIPDR